MTAELNGRTALVTGAGDGIGRGISLALGAVGARVVVSARRAESGEPVVDEIVRRGGAAVFAPCDVTRPADIDTAVTAAVDAFGGLDIVVHNAVSRRSSEVVALEAVDEELWEAHLSVSVRATYHCARAAFPYLRKRPGRFIVLSSAAGIEGSVGVPVYAAVKGAQRGLAKSLAREWGPFGITVNCIAPVAATPALENAFKENPDLHDRLVGRIPLGRIGDPEADIGTTAVFLAGDGAGYITGQTLVVDGGSFMGL